MDSDVVVRPDALAALLETRAVVATLHKPVVVALLVNNQIRDRLLYPQAIYNFGHQIEKKRDLVTQARGKYFQHGEIKMTPYTGACCLIDLHFIREHGIRYEPCVNGEDLGFCQAIRAAGGECWVDTSKRLEAYHIQEPWLIPGIQPYIDGALAEDAYKVAICAH